MGAKWPGSLLERLIQERAEHKRGNAKKVAALADADLAPLPLRWVWAPLDALATHVVDGVHKTPEYVESGVPFISVRNLTAGKGISFANVRYVSQADHERFSARARPEVGDLLISKDGTLGVTRAVRTNKAFSIFVSVALVKPTTTELTNYLELALNSPFVQTQMKGVGSGLQHLVLRHLKSLAIPLPPLEEQAEIVRRARALFERLGRVEGRLVSATDRVRTAQQSTLSKAFTGELLKMEV
jgi:type I restriction enzyme S subunit